MCVMLLDISASAHYKSIIHCTGIGPAAAVSVPAVVSGVICALLVGLVGGAGAGVAVTCVYIKWRSSRKETGPSLRQTPPPAPLYDDIELVATTKQVEPPLQHNVAYGHVNR